MEEWLLLVGDDRMTERGWLHHRCCCCCCCEHQSREVNTPSHSTCSNSSLARHLVVFAAFGDSSQEPALASSVKHTLLLHACIMRLLTLNESDIYITRIWMQILDLIDFQTDKKMTTFNIARCLDDCRVNEFVVRTTSMHIVTLTFGAILYTNSRICQRALAVCCMPVNTAVLYFMPLNM